MPSDEMRVESTSVTPGGALVAPIYTALDTETQVEQKIKAVAKKTFDTIGNVWSYLGKVLSISRFSLKIKINTMTSTTAKCLREVGRLTTVVRGLTLPAVLAIPGLIMEIPDDIRAIRKGIHLRDKEGLILGSVALTLATLDLTDVITTLTQTIADLAGSTAVEFLGVIGKPIGIALNILAIVTRSIKIHGLSNLQKEIDKMTDSETGEIKEEELSAFMEKHFEVTEAEREKLEAKHGPEIDKAIVKLKDKKRAKLERRVGEKALKGLENLHTRMKEAPSLSEGDRVQAAKLVKGIEKISWRKTALHIVGIVSAVFMLIGLTILFTTMPLALPLGIMIVAFMIKLAMVYYEKRRMEKGIEFGDFVE